MTPETLIEISSVIPDAAVLDEMLKPRVYVDAMSSTLGDPTNNNIPPYCSNCGMIGYPDVTDGERFAEDEDA